MTRRSHRFFVGICAVLIIHAVEIQGNCDDGKMSQSPTSEAQVIERQSGSFSFELTQQGGNSDTFTLTIKAVPKAGDKSVSIADESQALLSFLKVLAAKHVLLSNITTIYLPSVSEGEVRERIAKYAATSKLWKERTAQNSTKVLADMLLKSNAYSELDLVLRQHHLRIKDFFVEEILTQKVAAPDNASKMVKVPVLWTTFVRLEPDK